MRALNNYYRFITGSLKSTNQRVLAIAGGLVVIGVLLVINDQATPASRVERYFISSKDLPRFTEAFFEPFDFKPGEEQVVLIKLDHPIPVDSVIAEIKTDNFANTYSLRLAESSGSATIWRGAWRIKDTHKFIYRQTFQAVSGADQSQVELVFK